MDIPENVMDEKVTIERLHSNGEWRVYAVDVPMHQVPGALRSIVRAGLSVRAINANGVEIANIMCEGIRLG
jgi:hypothetical protein